MAGIQPCQSNALIASSLTASPKHASSQEVSSAGRASQDVSALLTGSVARQSVGSTFPLEKERELTEARCSPAAWKLAVGTGKPVVSWHLNERKFPY